MTKKTNKEFYAAQLTDRASECEIRALWVPIPRSQNLMTKAYLGALTLCYTNKKGRYKIIQIVRAL